MEIINPNQIGGKISKLIAEATEKFYAVTAFIDLSQWTIILGELKQACDRGVRVKIYFRKISKIDYEILDELGIELYQVKRLHTKFYLNEKEIIVSSMNFIEASDLYSIDIGLHYKDSDNYNKLYHYYLKYINSNNNDQVDYLIDDINALKDLRLYLSDRFTDSKINAGKSYLFSGNLVPLFDIFIMPNEITLKYPLKNLSADKIQELTLKLKSVVKNTITTKEPRDGYEYCTWDINTEKHSTTEFVNIISDLRQLN